MLVAIGVIINLPAIARNGSWTGRIAGVPSYFKCRWELSAPFQAIGYASLFYGFWPQLSRFKLVLAIACVGRMALTNYLLQTLICTTLFTTSSLFMQFDRLELLAFVIPVWLANIFFSCYLAALLPPGGRCNGSGVS